MLTLAISAVPTILNTRVSGGRGQRRLRYKKHLDGQVSFEDGHQADFLSSEIETSSAPILALVSFPPTEHASRMALAGMKRAELLMQKSCMSRVLSAMVVVRVKFEAC